MNATILLVVAATTLLKDRESWLTSGLLADLTKTFELLILSAVIFSLGLAVAAVIRRLGNNRVISRTAGAFALLPFVLLVSATILAGVALPALIYAHRKGNLRADESLWDSVLGGRLKTPLAWFEWFASVATIGGAIFLILTGILIWRDVFRNATEGGRLSRWGTALLGVGLLLLVAIAGALVLSMVRKAGLGKNEIDVSAGLLWLVLGIVSAMLRKVIVQYVGDVAIYVTPYRVDAFYELRNDIKAVVSRAARSVYSLQENGRHQYDAVFVMGHSLGSVIVYDALNELIMNDLADGTGLNVPARTPLMLTFGSPLDKTAFLFAVQHNLEGPREALASAGQPLIQEYSYRPAHWVNVYSPWDIISGPLDLYDAVPHAWHDLDAEGRRRIVSQRVCNLIDPNANTLLAAHVQYWDNSLIYEVLYQAIKSFESAPAWTG